MVAIVEAAKNLGILASLGFLLAPMVYICKIKLKNDHMSIRNRLQMFIFPSAFKPNQIPEGPVYLGDFRPDPKTVEQQQRSDDAIKYRKDNHAP